jgi:hypothetical protein
MPEPFAPKNKKSPRVEVIFIYFDDCCEEGGIIFV